MNNIIFANSSSVNDAMNTIALFNKVKKGVVRVAIMAIFLLIVGCKSVEASELTSAKQELQLVREINNLRAENGLEPLVLDKELNDVASVRSAEASQKWSHTRPNGTQGVNAIKGNCWKGENLSMMEGSADEYTTAEMFQMLCASETHYDNMVFSEFTRIGISSYEAADGCVYVAYMFAS